MSWPTPVWSMEANGFFLMISVPVICAEEAAGIVAAHAETGLGEVVGAEAEELSGLRDFVGGERAARNFDHRADV